METRRVHCVEDSPLESIADRKGPFYIFMGLTLVNTANGKPEESNLREVGETEVITVISYLLSVLSIRSVIAEKSEISL